MLIDFSVKNYTSFNSKQEFSMVASTSTKEHCDLDNLQEVNVFGVKKILKSAAFFGANASGKSNLIRAIKTLQTIVLGSLDSISEKTIQLAVPFLLKKEYFDEPTEFEVTFLASEKMYRYGLAIKEGEISEEWLYWTKNSRETLLFHREKQMVNFNQRSFSEAKSFVKKEGDSWSIEKTKPFVPFISVLSQFDGEQSVIITDWFQKLNVISGLRDVGLKQFTINLLEDNSEFKVWALEILKVLQIHDIQITEVETHLPIPKNSNKLNDAEISDALSKIESFLEKNKRKEKSIEVIKVDESTGNIYALPLSLESEGTRKLIYLLGPLYDVIKNNEILIVDEFDNKFHTLLSKFIIELYHKNNHGSSQLIITCHDTNLLTKDLFRRDQIWFIEKNNANESNIYSLVEYKEHYTRKEDSYSRDYLAGKYGAIPLFSSIANFGDILNG